MLAARNIIHMMETALKQDRKACVAQDKRKFVLQVHAAQTYSYSCWKIISHLNYIEVQLNKNVCLQNPPKEDPAVLFVLTKVRKAMQSWGLRSPRIF